MAFVPDAIRESALAQIRELPQAGIVLADMERVNSWIEAAYKVDPKRMAWHIRRAGGIGGSEIGVAAMELSGGADQFETLRRIVRKKLFMDPPDRPNAAMEIGTMFEPVVREALHQRLAPWGCCTDDAAYAKLKNSTVKLSRPWLIGNPDDIILLKGKRFIPDYKVTVSDGETYSSGEVAMRYVFQLHQYAQVLEGNGLKVDGLILAPYVRDEEGYFKLLTLNVKRDKEIDHQLLVAGDHCWKFVMDGELPDFPKKTRIDIKDEKRVQRLSDIARNFASYEAIASTAYKEAAGYKDQLKVALAERLLGDGALNLSEVVAVNVTGALDVDRAAEVLGEAAKSAEIPGELDQDKVLAYFKEQGLKIADFCTVSHDQEKLAELLGEAGLNLDDFRVESVRIGLMRSTKGALIREVRNHAADIVENTRKDILQMAQGAIPAAVPVAEPTKPRKTKVAEPAV